MRLKLISAAIFVLTASIFAQEYRIKLTASDAPGSLQVPSKTTLGWHVDATLCRDSLLGESPGPPAPAPQSLEIRFVPPRTNIPADCYPPEGFFELDLRKWENGVTLRDTFKLQVSNLANCTMPVTIVWDPISELSITGLRIVEVGGEAQTVDMLTNNSITLNDPDVTILRIFATSVLGVEEIGGLPSDFQLNQNYPNPFNPSTTIHFAIPFKSNVDISVYDVLGKKVKTLVSENMTPSNYSVEWNGTTNNGTSASSGIYFVRMSAVSENSNTSTQSIKVILMK